MVTSETSSNTGDRVDRLDEPAFPVADHGEFLSTGLTKREWFAATALQGLLVNADYHGDRTWPALAEDAVKCADNLIAALARPPKDNRA